MPKSEAQKAAARAYRKTIIPFSTEFYPNKDSDIIKQLDERVKAGETKSAYIKRLIREDIQKGMAE